MAKSKRKLSPTQREYYRQRRRIQNFLNRASKRGYFFDEILPPIPKTITAASVRRLQKLDAKALYNKAKYFVDVDTGEITTGARGRGLERARASRKAAETRRIRRFKDGIIPGKEPDEDKITDGGIIIWTNVYEELIKRLDSPTPEYIEDYYYGKKRRRGKAVIDEIDHQKSRLLQIIDNELEKIGKSKLGWRLQRHADEIDTITNQMLYAAYVEQVINASFQLAKIIMERDLTEEENEALTREAELSESWEIPE